MRGRPTKVDAATTTRIVELVRAGSFMETAAATCGIHRTTLHRWLEKGEAQSAGPYREFYLAVMRAQADSETLGVLIIEKAAQEDWRAAAWLLERRFPRRYGTQVHVTVRQEMEDMLKTLKERLPVLVYQEVLKALAMEGEAAGELP